MAPGKRSRGDITAPAADAPAQAAQPSGQNQPHVSTTSVPVSEPRMMQSTTERFLVQVLNDACMSPFAALEAY